MKLSKFVIENRAGWETRNRSRLRKHVLSAVVASVMVTALAQAQVTPADWPMFGQNASNTANNPTIQDITNKLVGKLQVKWTVTTTGDVSVRAAVANGIAYFPDWGPAGGGGSTLWAVNASNGNVVWSHTLSYYGFPGAHSRTTPAVVGGYLYLGTQEGAYLLAINAATGALVWKTQLESLDPAAAITSSPVVVNGVVYTGVTSLVEGGTAYGYSVTPSVSGSVVAITAATGKIQWKTRTVPTDQNGASVAYSGAGVWGSNPVVDTSRNTIFVGTGNNYRHPIDDGSIPGTTYANCISAPGGTPASCESTEDHVDSILALNLSDGSLKWATKLVTWRQYGITDGSDDWNVDCAFTLPPPLVSQCPSNPGPDYDFGSAPNEITYQSPTGPKTIIGAGQKSGIYYALNPDTGAVLWETQVGPGSSLGGMEWGSASDGKRIYVQITNLYGIPYRAGSAGSWAALDPATGTILWQTADPNKDLALGPMAVANGVVYASSMSSSPGAPTMLALDAATGQILWGFAAGSSVNAGATIVKDTVYWGSGYTHLPFPNFTGNNKFYAFTVNAK